MSEHETIDDLDMQDDDGCGVHASDLSEDGEPAVVHLSVAEGLGFGWGTTSAFLSRKKAKRLRNWLTAWLAATKGDDCG